MALRHLGLRDFVIVDALEFSPGAGFTALTGETGAGKSILVDALQLLLGARADALYVRAGQPRCELSAEFDAALPPAQAWLDAQGFDAESGAPLLLRRTIDRAGKSRAWINGSPATVAQLRELGDLLVDIHGQHAWQSLTRPSAMRALLDAYGGIDAAPLALAWQNWQAAEAELAQARAAQATLAEERDRLSWQLGELDKLAPAAGEWAELNARHGRLSHAQALTEAAQAAAQALDAEAGGAQAQLAQAAQRLAPWAALEPEFAAIGQVLADGAALAGDAAHSLHAWLRRAEPDPQALARLDERLAAWHALARRFRRPPEELPALQENWRAELAGLQARADLQALQTRAAGAQAACLAAAQAVSRQRGQAAPQLAAQVTQAMQGLGMEGGRFEITLSACAPSAHGAEQVLFLVTAHAGAAAHPIERVASGGELSRLALAIAVVTSRLGQAGTLVFDEVDAGIGGAVASTVGRLLHQLGADRQVLCVTHLPQVAACADQHWQVSKRAAPEGALSAIARLQDEARVQEIARMLGAQAGSDAGRAHAVEMLQTAAAPQADAPRRSPSKERV